MDNNIKIFIQDIDFYKELFKDKFIFNAVKLLSFAAKALEEEYIIFDYSSALVYFHNKKYNCELRITSDFNWWSIYTNIKSDYLHKNYLKDNCMLTALIYYRLINTVLFSDKHSQYSQYIYPILKEDFEQRFPNFLVNK